jgi:hypothetical protein
MAGSTAGTRRTHARTQARTHPSTHAHARDAAIVQQQSTPTIGVRRGERPQPHCTERSSCARKRVDDWCRNARPRTTVRLNWLIDVTFLISTEVSTVEPLTETVDTAPDTMSGPTAVTSFAVNVPDGQFWRSKSAHPHTRNAVGSQTVTGGAVDSIRGAQDVRCVA